MDLFLGIDKVLEQCDMEDKKIATIVASPQLASSFSQFF